MQELSQKSLDLRLWEPLVWFIWAKKAGYIDSLSIDGLREELDKLIDGLCMFEKERAEKFYELTEGKISMSSQKKAEALENPSSSKILPIQQVKQTANHLNSYTLGIRIPFSPITLAFPSK